MSKKVDIKTIISIILIILIVVGAILIISNFLKTNDNKEQEVENTVDDTKTQEQLKAVNFYENFSKIGNVEGLEEVIWNSARITQIENKMQVEIILNNKSKDKKIEPTNITVNLFDKEGNIVLTKDARTKEIPANYGKTTVNLELDIKDIVVIYDVQIIANK